MIELLGIDNVMFHVGDLETAIPFYESCGFVLKFRVDEKQMALFDIGPEGPGLVIRTDEGSPAGRLWVEVRNADEVRQKLLTKGLTSSPIETATGITCEIVDHFGNCIGFADYSKRPDLARR
ncbi:MAG: VOC family protein [Mesorhizobium sp.]|nr:MAG: VOC family protein [Mesorhizobium sp.]